MKVSMRSTTRPVLATLCGDVWVKVREQCDAKATSIGALMDSMHESVIDELDGAEIMLRRI